MLRFQDVAPPVTVIVFVTFVVSPVTGVLLESVAEEAITGPPEPSVVALSVAVLVPALMVAGVSVLASARLTPPVPVAATAPTKSLLALASVIVPAPACSVVAPATVSEPLWLTLPPLVDTFRPPVRFALGNITAPPLVLAVRSEPDSAPLRVIAPPAPTLTALVPASSVVPAACVMLLVPSVTAERLIPALASMSACTTMFECAVMVKNVPTLAGFTTVTSPTLSSAKPPFVLVTPLRLSTPVLRRSMSLLVWVTVRAFVCEVTPAMPFTADSVSAGVVSRLPGAPRIWSVDASARLVPALLVPTRFIVESSAIVPVPVAANVNEPKFIASPD